MTLMWIAIGTVEVCVLLLLVAAAVLTMAMRPGGKGPVENFFYGGTMLLTDSIEPAVTLTIDDDYRATLMRRGLTGVNPEGAVSLAVTVAGSDITVEERVTPGRPSPGTECPDSAMFVLDCLPPFTRIHFRYDSPSSSRGASTTFTVKPGLSCVMPLVR